MKRQRARHHKGKKNKRKKEPQPVEINFWTSAWKCIMLGSGQHNTKDLHSI